MRRRREEWILDNVSLISAAACDDPAEMLARSARLRGEAALELLELCGDDVFRDEMVAHAARPAWRFAIAAFDLYDLYHEREQ